MRIAPELRKIGALRKAPATASCAHIADFYDEKQREHQCIGNNFLRHGYRQWAEVRVTDPTVNNLFGES